ncbi:MAG: tetratricopeptide repeat protein [Planctomycetaceae bacterium]|nr:tetratricopeptide repeat protein [Planctomycetaceae bacterium]
MPESLRKLKISLLSRPFSLAAMVLGMALLGAAASSMVQGGKDSSSEEKPSSTIEKTQVAVGSEGPGSDIHNIRNHGDYLATDDLPTQETQPGGDETGVSRNSSHTEVRGEADAGDPGSGDPFSEESLGFSEPQGLSGGTELTADPNGNSAAVVTSDADSAPVHAAPEHTAKPAAPGNQAREEKSTQQAVNLMTVADEQLASGSYVQAMRAYQAIRQKSQGTPGAAILMRLALCAEAAGRRAAAMEAYRKVASIQADAAWAGVARYGEARCLAATKRHRGLQSDLLRRVLLDETEFVPTVRLEMLHLIGRDLWKEQSSMVSTDLLDDKTLTVPEWSADPARLLDELPLLIHETPTKAGPIQFQVLHFDDETPEGISVRLTCGTTRLEPLLQNLLNGCRLECELSSQALRQLQGRTQQIHVVDSRLATLLDGLTIPYDLCWRQQNETILIQHRDEATPEEFRQCRLRTAERLLRTAVTEGAGSRQTGHSRMALATLLYEQQRAADAVQFLQVQIESEPRSVVETEAAFNLGKCLMVLNERNEAREAFLRSIDAAGGLIDVKIAAYIFISRLLLEDDQGKLAVSNMMRGVALSEGTQMEPYAALQLGSAYLMNGNPQGANSVLMERREELIDGPGREAAAFISALARFRAAVLVDRREREGWSVVSALSEFKSDNYCGGHWAVLVAEACEDLGLEGQATDAYLLALKKLPACWLRDRTVMRLAARYQKDQEFEEARLLLATLTASEANQMAFLAKLRSAEVSLEQNHPEDAIRTCRLLIDATDTPQLERAALRIMGQAYERRKNHQAAIYCFAGMLPEESLAEQNHKPETSSTHASDNESHNH